jgi:hypothetical protein
MKMKAFEFVILLNKGKETYFKIKLKKHFPQAYKLLQSVMFKNEHKTISILSIR